MFVPFFCSLFSSFSSTFHVGFDFHLLIFSSVSFSSYFPCSHSVTCSRLCVLVFLYFSCLLSVQFVHVNLIVCFCVLCLFVIIILVV